MARLPTRLAKLKYGKFFGGTLQTAAGTAAGGATVRVLDPILQELANETWELNATVPPDAYVLAIGVAQGQVTRKDAYKWAAQSGYGKDQMDALVDAANTGPGVGEAFRLWRRGKIDTAGFKRALLRSAIEQEWIDALAETKGEPLDPADLARGIHRGLVPDPGLLKGTARPGPGKVPAYPQYGIDALAEALAAGIDHDHLGVLVGLQGNPMGAHEAAQAMFRGVIARSDYLRAIAEGNTRNEWADAIEGQSRQIPTSHEYLENALRGYTTLEEAIAGAAKHGMTAADATLIYQNQGRPMNVHQITQALARGGVFRPEPGEIEDPYMASIVEGNLKPAYYDLEKALRYTMPSTFAIRQLAQSKVWDEAKTRERLLWAGWNPDDAADVARAWSTSSASTTKEATAADLLTLYDGEKTTREQALAGLEALGYPADEAQRKVELVDARRVASAKTAAVSDLHTGYKKGELKRDPTVTALKALGLAESSATAIVNAWQTYLDAETASAAAS